MSGSARRRRLRKRAPRPEREEERFELRLAEYSAPFGEEMPWRETSGERVQFAVACHGLRPERGRLH